MTYQTEVPSAEYVKQMMDGVSTKPMCVFVGEYPCLYVENGENYRRYDMNMSDMGFFIWARTAIVSLVNRVAELSAVKLLGKPRWKHLKRGSTYVELGRGAIQTKVPLNDYDEVVIYQCETDGRIWVRTVGEFEDGRFVREEPLPVVPSERLVALMYRLLRDHPEIDMEMQLAETTDEPAIYSRLDLEAKARGIAVTLLNRAK
jgi:hypothetical protein